jgi:hypothetical protein
MSVPGHTDGRLNLCNLGYNIVGDGTPLPLLPGF